MWSSPYRGLNWINLKRYLNKARMQTQRLRVHLNTERPTDATVLAWSVCVPSSRNTPLSDPTLTLLNCTFMMNTRHETSRSYCLIVQNYHTGNRNPKKVITSISKYSSTIKTNVTENNNNAEKHFTHAIVYSSMKYCELYFYFLKLHVRYIFKGDLLCIINFKGSAVWTNGPL